MLEQRIQQQFFDSADLHFQSAEALARPVAEAAQSLLGCITAGGKLMVCGVGGAAALAQHFTALLVGRFERERPGLAALALSADSAVITGVAAQQGLEQVFAQQVRSLGQPGDVLVALDHGGGAPSVLAAIAAAQSRDMSVVALTGRSGGALRELLGETDVLVALPAERAARGMELQLLVLHCLCDALDLQLMGEQEPS